jgi:cysteinyl-tRNA synthetase
MDLLFPHHECEIAQNVAGYGARSVRYWMHNNMITINGQKMGRSLGNFITLDQFFSGDHEFLTRAYHPMTIRLFILQAQYRSTLDFSNEALEASEKGLMRLLKAMDQLDSIKTSSASSVNVENLARSCEIAMADDMNTPGLIAHLFEGVKWINALSEGHQTITAEDLDSLKKLYHSQVYEVLGITSTQTSGSNEGILDEIIKLVLHMRHEAKINKDFARADRIREELTRLGITIKDRKDGADWEIN